MKYTDFTDIPTLLRAAATSYEMQKEAGIADPTHRYNVDGHLDSYPIITNDMFVLGSSIEHNEFPLGVIEGKPFFKNDKMWFTGMDQIHEPRMIEIYDVRHIHGSLFNGTKVKATDGGLFDFNMLSWNEPKQKSVMVELPYWFIQHRANKVSISADQAMEIASMIDNACNKAIEEMK